MRCPQTGKKVQLVELDGGSALKREDGMYFNCSWSKESDWTDFRWDDFTRPFRQLSNLVNAFKKFQQVPLKDWRCEGF